MSTGAETGKLPDPQALVENWASITERSQRLLEGFMSRQAENPAGFDPKQLEILANPFKTFFEQVTQDPSDLIRAQMNFWQESANLWQQMSQRALGLDAEPVAEPERGDRRFRDEGWQNPVFDYIKQSYLLAAQYMMTSVEGGGDDKRAKQLEFYTRQFVDAMSPSNFVATNPAVLRETLSSGGQNLLSGLKNLLGDMERGDGELRVSMTDMEHFEVGKNVGVTPGKVIHETPLMQLIQYEPTTKTVFSRPLLIVPPWINKFYILDLQPKNSFIRWAIEQGHTVFVISWVNPDAKLADKSFDDYLMEGSLAAIDAVEKATGVRELNMVGYCLGGTLLATTLAHLAAKGDDRVKSATYFASLVDFSEPGNLGVFIDEDNINLLEAQMEKDGFLDGATMGNAFNALRSNDLIWSFVVNNYLLGREPAPFDLLFWNNDSTRMPRAMHSFYLRNMYLDNKLSQPGALSIGNTPIDLGKVEVPSYIVSPREDHIAPWQATYKATQLYGGPVRFVLGGSGHIAGIINPPSANKYGHWLNDANPADAQEWLAGAEAHEGSWWTDWQAWVKPLSGRRVKARVPGDGALTPIEDTPGRYVMMRDLPA